MAGNDTFGASPDIVGLRKGRACRSQVRSPQGRPKYYFLAAPRIERRVSQIFERSLVCQANLAKLKLSFTTSG